MMDRLSKSSPISQFFFYSKSSLVSEKNHYWQAAYISILFGRHRVVDDEVSQKAFQKFFLPSCNLKMNLYVFEKKNYNNYIFLADKNLNDKPRQT